MAIGAKRRFYIFISRQEFIPQDLGERRHFLSVDLG
jgi:hypothetical protein